MFLCIVGYNIRLRVSGYSQLAIYPATPDVNMYKQGGLVCLFTTPISTAFPTASDATDVFLSSSETDSAGSNADSDEDSFRTESPVPHR